MDYHPQALDSVSQETLDALGWDASEVELVRQWYFMDENITADALRLIQNGSAQAFADGTASKRSPHAS